MKFHQITLPNLSETVKGFFLAMKQNKWLRKISGYNKYEKYKKIIYNDKKRNVGETVALEHLFYTIFTRWLLLAIAPKHFP